MSKASQQDKERVRREMYYTVLFAGYNDQDWRFTSDEVWQINRIINCLPKDEL